MTPRSVPLSLGHFGTFLRLARSTGEDTPGTPVLPLGTLATRWRAPRLVLVDASALHPVPRSPSVTPASPGGGSCLDRRGRPPPTCRVFSLRGPEEPRNGPRGPGSSRDRPIRAGASPSVPEPVDPSPSPRAGRDARGRRMGTRAYQKDDRAPVRARSRPGRGGPAGDRHGLRARGRGRSTWSAARPLPTVRAPPTLLAGGGSTRCPSLAARGVRAVEREEDRGPPGEGGREVPGGGESPEVEGARVPGEDDRGEGGDLGPGGPRLCAL